jgi:transcriptional regulator with XRE-family HTH domain
VANGKRQRPKTLEEACGRVVIEHRERLKLSQMDLAVATGYSLRYIGDIERGNKSATLRTMHDLATLFKVSLGSLIGEAEMLLSDTQSRAASKRKSRRPY